MMLADTQMAIRAVRTFVPDTTQTAEAAIAAGLADPNDVAVHGVRELPVSHQESAPQMALRAARLALAAADLPADRVDVLIHAWAYHQGHDFWSPAHYIADRLGASRAMPYGIQQMCNGGATGIQVAVAHLLADPTVRNVLVTTADRFDPAGFDRWRGDYGLVYGDGATATLVRRDPRGELVLRGMASVPVPGVEAMHRGADPFSPAPRWWSERVDVRRTKKAYAASAGLDGFAKATHQALTKAVTGALRGARVAADDRRLRLVALPRVGARILHDTYHPAVRELVGAEIVSLGESTGHLGAGDAAANMASIVSGRMLEPGELALVVSAGAGFTYSCLLVEAPN